MTIMISESRFYQVYHNVFIQVKNETNMGLNALEALGGKYLYLTI